MNRISPDTENRITSLWFQGYLRDTIAQITGVSGSTVSEVIARLPQELTGLRKLAVGLKKYGLSVSEAGNGAKLLGKLAELGVDFSDLQDFLEAAEKMCRGSDYEPRHAVQAAMKLQNLEKASGKPYPQAILDFETVKVATEKQEQKRLELTHEIRELQEQRKREIATNRITEQEIAYNADLRQDLRAFGVDLSDVENLRKYLQNMREMQADPKKFAEYTRVHGSLLKQMAFLEQRKNEEMLSLQGLQEKQRIAEVASGACQSSLSKLNKLVDEEQNRLQVLREETTQAEENNKQTLARSSVLLQVEAEAEKVVDALGVKQKELDGLHSEIAVEQERLHTLQQHGQELANRNEAVESEICGKLGITDYASQVAAAIADKERKNLLFEEENRRNQERLALADTMGDFFVRMPNYDFNRLSSYFESLKKARETRSLQPQAQIPELEEEIRTMALKVFEGDLVSKRDYKRLWGETEELKKMKIAEEMKVPELEARLEKVTRSLERAQSDNRILEAVKVNFEGRTTTIREIRDFVLSIFSEGIRKSAEERHNATAAAVHGLLDFAADKIAHWVRNRTGGNQL
jgi:cation transport regulator ChaC